MKLSNFERLSLGIPLTIFIADKIVNNYQLIVEGVYSTIVEIPWTQVLPLVLAIPAVVYYTLKTIRLINSKQEESEVNKGLVETVSDMEASSTRSKKYTLQFLLAIAEILVENDLANWKDISKKIEDLEDKVEKSAKAAQKKRSDKKKKANK